MQGDLKNGSERRTYSFLSLFSLLYAYVEFPQVSPSFFAPSCHMQIPPILYRRTPLLVTTMTERTTARLGGTMMTCTVRIRTAPLHCTFGTSVKVSKICQILQTVKLLKLFVGADYSFANEMDAVSDVAQPSQDTLDTANKG